MALKKKIAIYGAGGLGREVFAMMKALPEWEVMGFYDDGKVKGERISHTVVLGGMPELLQVMEETDVVVAIGNPQIKRQLIAQMWDNSLVRFPVLVHPNALIQDMDTVKIGAGSIITAGVILTTTIDIGNHVLVNLNATVGHDVRMGDYSSVMPGANIAGEVQMASGVFIGSGANVLNGLYVGEDSRVGAGAVVTKDVPANTTVVGVPAKPIKAHA